MRSSIATVYRDDVYTDGRDHRRTKNDLIEKSKRFLRDKD